MADKHGVTNANPNGLRLRAFTYNSRVEALPALRKSVVSAGGWMLHRKHTSPTSAEVRVEIQSHRLLDLYAAIIAAGMELTRPAHRAMAEACSCALHLPERRRSIATVHVDVSFLGDVDLASVMEMPGALA